MENNKDDNIKLIIVCLDGVWTDMVEGLEHTIEDTDKFIYDYKKLSIFNQLVRQYPK